MEAIKLTKDNKEILRTYYINLYIIELKDMGIYKENMYDEVCNAVDYMIERYERNEMMKRSFPKHMTNYNPLYRKYNINLILTGEKVKLIKQGQTKYLETLIDYQKNVFMLNYRLFVLKNNTKFNEELLEKGYQLIDNAIRKYFDEKVDTNFTTYLTRVTQDFYFNNNLKTESKERNIVIDNKNGNSSNREELYEMYYELSKKRIRNITNLPEEKFNKFLRKTVEIKIDNYFNDSEKISTLRNMFESFFNRIDGKKEQIIVKYNLLFDDFYEESISFIENSINEYISTYIKENDIKSIGMLYRLRSFNRRYAKEYLDNCINENRYTPYKFYVTRIVNELVKPKKTGKSFDPEIVINGDEQTKEEQLELLKEELSYIKDVLKEKYIYYIDKDSVDKRIDNAYDKTITSYVDSMFEKKNYYKKSPAAYISIMLNQNAKTYSNTTKRKFAKNNMEMLLVKQYNDIIENYIAANNLFSEELDTFLEYMNTAFNNYIDKGSYTKDIRLYMKDIIDIYDYNFAKNIIAIKDAEELGIKVLRHPVIK